MYTTLHDSINNGTGHTLRIRHYDTPKADVYNFLPGLASLVYEIYQIRRRLPFLGPDICVVQEPVA